MRTKIWRIELKIINGIINSQKENKAAEKKLNRLRNLHAYQIRKYERELFHEIQEEFNDEDLLNLQLEIKIE
jgi:hypothetical protein